MFPFSGTAPAPTIKDLLPEPASEDEYSESLAFTAWLDDGTRVTVNFAVTNIGLGSKNAGVSAGVVFKDGKRAAFSQEVGRKWSASAEGTFHYEVGAGKVTGSLGNLLVTLSHGTFSGTLRFKAELPPFRPRSGRVSFGGPHGAPGARFYDYLAVQPRARVSARLRAGGRVVTAEGTGFLQRSRVNLYPFDQATRWRALNVYQGDTSIVLNEFVAGPRYGGRRVGWLVIGHKGRIVWRTFGYRLTPSDTRTDPGASYKYPVAWAFELAAESGSGETRKSRVSGTLKASRIVVREDPLSEMGRLKRAIVSRYARPMSYAMRCGYDLEVRLHDKDEPVRLKGDDAECWQTFVK